MELNRHLNPNLHTINDLKNNIMHNQFRVPLIFEEIHFCYGEIEIKNENPYLKKIF